MIPATDRDQVRLPRSIQGRDTGRGAAITPFSVAADTPVRMTDNPHQANAEEVADQEVDANEEDAEDAVEDRRQAEEEYEEERIQEELEHEDEARHEDAREEANPDNHRDDEPWD